MVLSREFEVFKKLSNIFKLNSHILYIVGGYVRDYLLKKENPDIDIVSDATPKEVKKFLSNYITCEKYSNLGSLTIKIDGIRFEYTTLRKESNYEDSRHPLIVDFVKTLQEDYSRRDFTINALYMDEKYEIYDFCGGIQDINRGIIRTIGNPKDRILEDPLRIIRALRFSLLLGFDLDEKLKETISTYKDKLDTISLDKIKNEIKKISNVDINKLYDLFKKFSIDYLLNVVD